MSIKSYFSSIGKKIKNRELITSTVRETKEKLSKIGKDKNYKTERYNPDPNNGLSKEQVQSRIKHKETNTVKSTSEKTYAQIIFNNIFTFYNIFMAAIAFILITVVGISVILNLSFTIILIINVFIGIIQECKSKNSIEKLKLLNKGKVTVIRDGECLDILHNEIVLDDIVKFKNGDQISADCIILDGDVEVNESLLTGESRPVKKHNGDILLAGSYIISGVCTCRADKIAKDTYLYSIEAKAKNLKQTKSKLMIDTNRIIKTLAFIAIPLSIIVFFNEMLAGSELTSSVLYWGTTITYMIPAGLVLITSISMATGVVKLATKKTLAQDLYSVEALSRVNTLCLDKTGTITDGTMVVDSVHIIDYDANVDGIMSSYLKSVKSTNQTSIALSEKYHDSAIFDADKVVEFKSENKFSMVKFKNGDAYALGAPEYLTDKQDLLKIALQAGAKGLRVIALVQIKGKFTEDSVKSKSNNEIALFMIRDNIRPEVKKTLQWFRENDVDVRVISGDNIGTVSYIAKEAGVEHWDKCFDMSTLTEDDDLEYIVMTNSIFGRVTPEQKVEIVEILQKNGRKVSMTGDGINDIAALKKADCSIALANGAPATKNIANLVLLDSNFDNMREAVMEGRRVVNNIQRSSSLFIMKDFFWLFITLLPILLGMTHQLEPTIMTIVNVILTGVCSFVLALEPDKSRIRGNFLKTVLGKAISAGFFMFLPVLLIYSYAFMRVGLDRQAVTDFISYMVPVISICVTISGCVIFYKLCQPFTPFRRNLFIFAICVIALLLTGIPEFFLINGTEYISSLISANNTFGEIVGQIGRSMFSFKIYAGFTVEQWCMVCGFLVLSIISYTLCDKLVMKLLNITMFNKMDDED